MSVKQVSVNVCGEVDSLLDVVLTAIKDVKAGKSALSVVTDVGPTLVGVLTSIGELSSELKDRTDLERTIALKAADFADVLVPVPAPAPAPVPVPTNP